MPTLKLPKFGVLIWQLQKYCIKVLQDPTVDEAATSAGARTGPEFIKPNLIRQNINRRKDGLGPTWLLVKEV